MCARDCRRSSPSTVTPIESCRISMVFGCTKRSTRSASTILITIPGGGHGNFTPEQRTMIYTTIQQFLRKNGLMAAE